MNTPFKPPASTTPDILLSGEAVNQIIMALNNPTILAKSSDGSMRPFIDPSPIGNIIFQALQAAGVPLVDPNEKAN
jgi:hypothetical protein